MTPILAIALTPIAIVVALGLARMTELRMPWSK